jgi:hypothetical protein
MPRVGFEPTIPAFQRVKTVHALERAVSVIGAETYSPGGIKYSSILIQPYEFVGCCDGVKVGLLPIVEIRVGLPNSLQH